MVSFRFVSSGPARSHSIFRVIPYYGGMWRKVLADRFLFSGFVVAATLNAAGHGATALAAGLLGSALASPSRLISSSLKAVSDPSTLAFVGVVATALKGAGATAGATLQSRLAQNVVGGVRQRLAARLLAFGGPLPAGQLAARLSVGLREIEVGVEQGLLAGIRAALTLVPLAAALYVESSTLAWGAVLLLGAFGCAMSLARRHWKRWQTRASCIAEGLHRELEELVAHMDVWRTFGAGERVCRALEGLGNEAARSAGRAEATRAALSSANEFLGAVALVATIAFARRMSIPLGDGTLVVFAALFFMSYRPLRDLGDARAAIDRGAAALVSLDALAPRGAEPPAAPPRSKRAWLPAALRVEGAGVEREAESIARTSFAARPGEIVAVVGPTGSGKTTLLRALLGLEPTAVGKVSYGDEDLTGRGVGPHERPFAWMPQDSPILSGTLEDNVLCGDEGAKRLGDVLGSIGAERLLVACNGAVLGGAGRAVSGGERKWIALARAMATELPVLLLDEPTAGLDRDAQAGVLRALGRLRGKRTVVIVSHEAHVVAIADRVVRVGEIEHEHVDEDEDVHEYEDEYEAQN